jgi:hypothetical protein
VIAALRDLARWRRLRLAARLDAAAARIAARAATAAAHPDSRRDPPSATTGGSA